jgi:hypothetical protein
MRAGHCTGPNHDKGETVKARAMAEPSVLPHRTEFQRERYGAIKQDIGATSQDLNGEFGFNRQQPEHLELDKPRWSGEWGWGNSSPQFVSIPRPICCPLPAIIY